MIKRSLYGVAHWATFADGLGTGTRKLALPRALARKVITSSPTFDLSRTLKLPKQARSRIPVHPRRRKGPLKLHVLAPMPLWDAGGTIRAKLPAAKNF
jgi:hypothetical protein